MLIADKPKRCEAFLQDMSVVPDVRVEDMGHKMGCNGVDNGKLWFDGGSPSASYVSMDCLGSVCFH